MVHKGQIVYFYPYGDLSYGDALPAIVMDHSSCGMVVTLKALRIGTDVTKQNVKRYDHPSFVQHPHHASEQGFWADMDVRKPDPDDDRESKPARSNRQSKQKPQSQLPGIEEDVMTLAQAGMSASAIVGRLAKDTNVTLEEVTRIMATAK